MIGGVFIGVPAVEWMFTRAVQALDELLLPPGSERMFELGHSSIAAKRNLLVRYFLKSRREWLFFLDSDMLPPCDTVQRLLARNEAIVGALAYGRVAPFPAAAGFTDPQTGGYIPVERGIGLREVYFIGGACVLIHRDVFEKTSSPWFEHPAACPGFGEEMLLWTKARAAGFRTMCDTDVVVGHLTVLPVPVPQGVPSTPPLDTVISFDIN